VTVTTITRLKHRGQTPFTWAAHIILGRNQASPWSETEVEMKALVSALALLVGSNVMALAADQTLKFKLIAFTVGEKDGEYHMVGATVSPDGTIGTKDFSVKEDQNGKGTIHSTYNFPAGSIVTSGSFVDTATQTGGHVVGKYQIVSGAGAYQGATGVGSFEGDWGDKSALKGAALYNIELDVKTPGS
jgi:hypothetical protein